TGASIKSELTGAGAGVWTAGAPAGSDLSAWPRTRDGTRPSTSAGFAPSTPRIRISRLLSSSRRPRTVGLVSERPETSITTDLPAKKPGERASKTSTSASQASMGDSGLTTRAWKEPPRNLKDGRAVDISLTLSADRTAIWLTTG